MNAQKFAEKTETNLKEISKIEGKWKAEIEKLKTEIIFKEQELKEMNANKHRKQPKTMSFMGAFESESNPVKILDDVKRPRNDGFGPREARELISTGTDEKNRPEIKEANEMTKVEDLRTEILNHLAELSDLDLVYRVLEILDTEWDFGNLEHFDSLDIVKARELLTKTVRSEEKLAERGSGRALATGIVKLYEHGIYLRQVKHCSRLLKSFL